MCLWKSECKYNGKSLENVYQILYLELKKLLNMYCPMWPSLVSFLIVNIVTKIPAQNNEFSKWPGLPETNFIAWEIHVFIVKSMN